MRRNRGATTSCPPPAARALNAMLAIVLMLGICIPTAALQTSRAYAASDPNWPDFKAITGTTGNFEDPDMWRDKADSGSSDIHEDHTTYQHKSLDGENIWCAADSNSNNMPSDQKVTSVNPVASLGWKQSVVTDLALAWYWIYKDTEDPYKTPAGKTLTTADERYVAFGVMSWGILREAEIKDGKHGKYADDLIDSRMYVKGVDITGWNTDDRTPNGPWKALKTYLEKNRSKYIGHMHYFDFKSAGGQSVAGMYEVEKITGALCGTKTSAAPEVTDGNGYYSLEGAVYGVFDSEAKAATHDAGQAIKTYTTRADGYWESASEYEDGKTYYVSEISPSPGYQLDQGVYTVTAAAGKTTPTPPLPENPQLGGVQLNKVSAKASLTDGNGCYSLAGAVYGVFASEDAARSHDAGQAVKVMPATDESGHSQTGMELTPGNYWVAETTPSEGYKLDSNTYPVTVTSNALAQAGGSALKEPTRNDPIGVLLQKIDRETGKPTAQGAGSLAGAEYTVKYYDGYYNEGNLPSPTRTWVVKTNDLGLIEWENPFKVSGDDFYTNEDGARCMPLGTVSVVETKAPAGYNLEGPDGKPKTYVFQIQPDDSTQSGGNAVGMNYTIKDGNYKTESSDEPKRGDYRLVKSASIDINTDAPQEQKRVLVPGVKFQIINDNEAPVLSPETGEEVAKGGVVCTITTDENGLADTRAGKATNGWNIPNDWTGALVYGTYKVHEEIPADVQAKFKEKYGFDLNPIDDEMLKVSITEEGQQDLSELVNNNIDQSPLRVIKVDDETGEKIPAATKWQILDSKGEVVKHTFHSPVEETVDTFTATENGEITLPMMLPGGSYKLVEVQAPEGYILGSEEIPFTVDEYRTWNNPIEVTVPNKPAKGKIQIQKKDAETGEAIEGAQYVIAAYGDIKTGDGTVRLADGTTAAVVTTDSHGTAETPELYLGSYKVYEAKSPEGWALDTEEHIVTIAYEDQNTPVVTVAKELYDKPTKIKVVKTDAKDGKPVEGAEFRVWSAGGEETYEYDTETLTGKLAEAMGVDTASITDPNALAVGLQGAKEGESIKLEVSSKTGNMSKSTEIAVIPGENKSMRVVYGNEAEANLKGDIMNVPGKASSADQAFDQTITTDKDGIAEIKYLKHGSYHIVETKAPEGYYIPLDNKQVDFSVDAQGQTGTAGGTFSDTFTLNATNAPIKIGTTLMGDGKKVVEASEKLTVVDTISYEGLTPGTEYKVSGTLHEADVDENGNKTDGGALKDADGKEVTASAVFKPESENGKVDVTFTFNATGMQGKTLVAFEQLHYNTTGDVPEVTPNGAHEVTVSKTDATTTAELPGAMLIVKNKAGETVAQWVSTTEPKKIKLDEGEYTLTEVTAPNGYEVAETIAFTVDANGLVGSEKVQMADKPVEEKTGDGAHEVTVSKTDATTTAELPGATLIVKNKAGETVAQWVSTTEPKKIKLDEGEYTLTELTAPKGYTVAETIAFTVNDKGLVGSDKVQMADKPVEDKPIATHEDITDPEQSVDVKPEAKTTLVDKATGNHTARVGTNVELVDTITFKGLVPGTEYKALGVLMDRETERPLTDADGNQVSAETTFTPKKSEGTVQVTFVLDTSSLAGTSAVAYETIMKGDVTVVTHNDPKDEEQTVNVPKIATTATDAADGDKVVDANAEAKVVDTVQYSGLTVGKEYTMEGTLHLVKADSNGNRTDGGALADAEGNAITVRQAFTPETTTGSVAIEFTIDASKLNGKAAVAFETLYQGDVKIADHNDPNDEEQTVVFVKNAPKNPVNETPEKTTTPTKGTPSPSSSGNNSSKSPLGSTFGKTGEFIMQYWWLAALLAACGIACGAYTLHKRFSKQGTDEAVAPDEE